MTVNADRKGKEGEREVVTILNDSRLPGPFRRGRQDTDAHTSCDVEGTAFWLEVKRYASKVPWRAGYQQATTKRDAAGDPRPVLVAGRVNHGKWWSEISVMDLANFVLEAMKKGHGKFLENCLLRVPLEDMIRFAEIHEGVA